jgi:hypothetical protein
MGDVGLHQVAGRHYCTYTRQCSLKKDITRPKPLPWYQDRRHSLSINGRVPAEAHLVNNWKRIFQFQWPWFASWLEYDRLLLTHWTSFRVQALAPSIFVIYLYQILVNLIICWENANSWSNTRNRRGKVTTSVMFKSVSLPLFLQEDITKPLIRDSFVLVAILDCNVRGRQCMSSLTASQQIKQEKKLLPD